MCKNRLTRYSNERDNTALRLASFYAFYLLCQEQNTPSSSFVQYPQGFPLALLAGQCFFLAAAGRAGASPLLSAYPTWTLAAAFFSPPCCTQKMPLAFFWQFRQSELALVFAGQTGFPLAAVLAGAVTGTAVRGGGTRPPPPPPAFAARGVRGARCPHHPHHSHLV